MVGKASCQTGICRAAWGAPHIPSRDAPSKIVSSTPGLSLAISLYQTQKKKKKRSRMTACIQFKTVKLYFIFTKTGLRFFYFFSATLNQVTTLMFTDPSFMWYCVPSSVRYVTVMQAFILYFYRQFLKILCQVLIFTARSRPMGT